MEETLTLEKQQQPSPNDIKKSEIKSGEKRATKPKRQGAPALTREAVLSSPLADNEPDEQKISQATTDAFAASGSKFDPLIPRRLLERICDISTNTVVKYESEGLIQPIRTKRGNLEVVAYTISDVQAVLRKKGMFANTKGIAEIIAVFSQKGGQGKSAFTQQLAGLLSIIGRVLVVDLDSQADATTLLGLNSKYTDIVDPDQELDPTIAELMDWTLAPDENGDISELDYRRSTFENVVKRVTPTLHVIPSDLDIADINYSLNRFKLSDRFEKDGTPKVPPEIFMIRDVLESIRDQYDYILMDLPPNIETFNVNALFAANRIVMPLELEAKCLRTMRRNEDFLFKLQSLDKRFHWDKILVVPNKFSHTGIKMKALAKLQDLYEGRTDNIQLSNCVFTQKTIVDRCAANKEGALTLAMGLDKNFKSLIPDAKEFADLFWLVIHEVLDFEPKRLLFADAGN